MRVTKEKREDEREREREVKEGGERGVGGKRGQCIAVV